MHFTPETEKKLNDLAALSGRGTADALVQDVIERVFRGACGKARCRPASAASFMTSTLKHAR